MKLLLSVCNKPARAQHGPNGGVLWEYDTGSSQLHPIPLDDAQLPECDGVTGLALYRDGFVVVRQSDPTVAVYLDRNYKIIEWWSLPMVREVHSLCVRDDTFYIASTGTDSIVEFHPDRGERLFWQANSMGEDSWHINSLAWHRDTLIITAFGPRTGSSWRTAEHGFVFDTRHNQRVWEDIVHPHSLVIHDEAIYLCQSPRMSVDRSDGQSFTIGNGYARGLFLSDSWLCAALSVGRKRSRSTGSIIGNPAEGGLLAGECTLMFCDWNGRDLATALPQDRTPLHRFAWEIYDILPLGD